jgi:hypothetical protein
VDQRVATLRQSFGKRMGVRYPYPHTIKAIEGEERLIRKEVLNRPRDASSAHGLQPPPKSQSPSRQSIC